MHEPSLNRVVIATNGSTACRRAIVRATTFFRDARLVAAVVLPADPPSRAPVEDDPSIHLFLPPSPAAVAESPLHAYAGTLPDVCRALGPQARSIVLTGDPAHAVIRVATAERADVIVVGSLRGARGRTLLPSIANDLVAGAPCPVIELGRDRGAVGSA